MPFIELHGNHYGPDLGYEVDETLQILGDHGLRVSGVCGMFSADNDLSSNRATCRQAAMDYLRREIPFTQAVGGSYFWWCRERWAGRRRMTMWSSSVRQRRWHAPHLFVEHGVKAAIEPIRAAEVSFVIRSPMRSGYIGEVNSSRRRAYQRRRLPHAVGREPHRRGYCGCRRQASQPAFCRQQPLRPGRRFAWMWQPSFARFTSSGTTRPAAL